MLNGYIRFAFAIGMLWGLLEYAFEMSFIAVYIGLLMSISVISYSKIKSLKEAKARLEKVPDRR